MGVKFLPKEFVKKIAPEAKIKRMVSSKMGFKRTALSFVDRAADTEVGVLNKKSVASVVRKTIDGYQERVAKATVDANFDKQAGKELQAEIISDPKQLIQRVQNEIIFQVHVKIKEQYKGQKARWLPSGADEPRPEHALNYGKEYIIGEGIDGIEPGDEPGCDCGVEILNETSLDLD